MKRYLKKNAVSIVSGVLSLVAMWLVWLIAEKTVSNEYVIPSFAQTLEALKQAKINGNFEEVYEQITGNKFNEEQLMYCLESIQQL